MSDEDDPSFGDIAGPVMEAMGNADIGDAPPWLFLIALPFVVLFVSFPVWLFCKLLRRKP